MALLRIPKGREVVFPRIFILLVAELILVAGVATALARAQTPVAHWTFDEGSGVKAADSIGHQQPAALVNGVRWVPGRMGNAVSAFSGSGQYLRIPSLDLRGGNAVTVSLWVRHAYDPTSEHVLFEATADFAKSQTGFALFSDDSLCGGIRAALRGDVGFVTNCYAQPPSEGWHHLALVLDKTRTGGDEVQLYLDGAPQTPTRNLDASTNTNQFGQNSLFVFSRGGTTLFDSGAIDDLRVYDSALNAQQIHRIYKLGTVQSGPADFAMSIRPSSLTVVRGNSGTSVVSTVVNGGGFSTSVSLSVSGLPAGTSVSFNPNPIPAPGAGSATVLIAIGPTTRAGTYPITITGSGDGMQHSANLSLTVFAQVALNWNASVDPVAGYNVYRSSTQNGPYEKLNSALIKATNYVDQTAQSGYTYYYAATAVDAQGRESGYSNHAVATVR